jgi:WD40 repeat protein
LFYFNHRWFESKTQEMQLNSFCYRIHGAAWLVLAFILLVAGCRQGEGSTASYGGPIPEGAAKRLGKGEITSLSFAPATGGLFAGSKVGVSHYDAANLQQRWQVATSSAVRDVAASENGEWLLAGLEEGALLLLDGEDGALIESWPGYTENVGIYALAWDRNQSADGFLAAAGFDNGNILLLRVGEKEVQTIGVLPRQRSGITALIFNPDGRILASGNKNGDLHLIDLELEILLGTLAGHENAIEDIAWSPDGTWLLSGDKDGVVIEWDLNQLSAAKIWPAESESIIAVDFMSGGEQLAMATEGGTLERWTAGQTVDGVRADAGSPLLAVAFNDELAQVAAAGDDGLLRTWSSSGGADWPGGVEQTQAGHAPRAGQALAVAFDPSGDLLLASLGSDVAVWDSDLEIPRMIFKGHDAIVSAEAWSPDGSLVASGDRSGRIIIWDGSSGEPVRTLDYHKRPVGGLAWSPDGSELASTGSLADELVVWRVEDGQILHELQGAGDGLWPVAWSPDGTRLAAGSTGGILFIWETADFAAQPQQFRRHQAWISDLEWFEDSQRLISGGGDSRVVLWDVVQRNSSLLPGHSAPVRGVALSPDGSYAVSAAINGEGIIWRTDPRALEAIVTRLNGHTDGMTGTGWSPDGEFIATASEDGTILMWDLGSVTLD